MKIKHLQLNTSALKYPDKISDFIKNNNIDIACLQEVIYPIDGKSPIPEILKDYNYVEGLHFKYLPNNQSIAVAIISRWPIIDYHLQYYNTQNFEPKVISKDDILGELINDNSAINFPGSRGIKHIIKSRCIITALIQTPSRLVKIMSTHYTVSDLCTEILPMLEMSEMIASQVKYSNDLPTIFSADLNIRAGSYSVLKLSEIMDCHTKDLKDTLSQNHEAKKKDFPDGLAIDHVFSKGLVHLVTNAIEVDFSNHKAIISEFEI